LERQAGLLTLDCIRTGNRRFDRAELLHFLTRFMMDPVAERMGGVRVTNERSGLFMRQGSKSDPARVDLTGQARIFLAELCI
jgi:hypothetical protein